MNNKPNSVAALTLGGFIREKRLQQGVSMRELAKRLEIPFPFLWKIEQGKRNPPTSVLDQIAKNLDLSVDEFLGRNPKVAVRYFEQLLVEEPELGVLVVSMIRGVLNKRMSVSSLKKLLSIDATMAPLQRTATKLGATSHRSRATAKGNQTGNGYNGKPKKALGIR